MNNGHNTHTHIVPIKVYLLVYAALLVLLVATVGAAYLPGHHTLLNNVIALTIAVVKAVLVMLYFMHVRYSTRLTWLWASAGFFWLVIMFILTLGDYFTRHWVPVSGWE
ncbi:MAG: cytochrome C oxidase subunit IV family protein [Armatimonadota bacterium]